MDKKVQSIESAEKEELNEEEKSENEAGGFPEDIDFKKFLGCVG